MEKCVVCGGVTTCPLHDFSAPIAFEFPLVLQLAPGDYEERNGAIIFPKGSHLFPLSGLPAQRLSFTHYKKAYNIAVVSPAKNSNRQLYTCGSTQRYRVLDHFPEAPVEWVGQCTYTTQLVYKKPTYYVVPVNRFTGEVLDPLEAEYQPVTFGGDEQIACIAESHKDTLGMWQREDLPQERVFDTIFVTFRPPGQQPLHEITIEVWQLKTFFGQPDANRVSR